MIPGIRNIKAAEQYILAVDDPAERQWLEYILFELMVLNGRSTHTYEYDCDCLYVIHAMQLLWRRNGVLLALAQRIIQPNSMPHD